MASVVLGPYLVARAVARSELSLGAVRLALVPAAVAVAAIVTGTVATLALSVLSAQRSPDLYNPVASPVVIALMVAASALAGAALWRGLGAGWRPGAAGAAG